jgi:hypothetical protein
MKIILLKNNILYINIKMPKVSVKRINIVIDLLEEIRKQLTKPKPIPTPIPVGPKVIKYPFGQK